MGDYMRVEDLKVYQKLCLLHIEVSDVSRTWPSFERFELAGQVRRSSNSSPAQLVEKHSDRHVKNKIEGVNRSRGETLESVHHLFMAHLKGCLEKEAYDSFHERYHECVRMLNGLERKLEQQLDPRHRRFPDNSS